MSFTDTERKRFTKWRIDLAIHIALVIARKRSILEAFQRLLAVVISRSDLLRPFPVSGYAGWAQAEKFLRGLLALCQHRRSWLREVYEWDAPVGNPLQQFGSLARHLLASHSTKYLFLTTSVTTPTRVRNMRSCVVDLAEAGWLVRRHRNGWLSKRNSPRYGRATS